MLIDEDLKTHIMEGERSQRHPRTLSSPVSCDEGSLRALIPQTRIQRPQPRPRHQQHQLPHPRPPHQPQCPPMSRTRRLLQLVPLDLPQDSPRLSPATFSSGTTKWERETAAGTADLLSAWGNLISARKMTLSSDILPNLIRRTWPISYQMVDL